MLRGGLGLGIIGSLVAINGAADFVNDQLEGRLYAGGILAITGGAAMLGSIPFLLQHQKIRTRQWPLYLPISKYMSS
ncbi:MAG: hypothetical protein ABI416_08285 [Ginsengibacter sp.]